MNKPFGNAERTRSFSLRDLVPSSLPQLIAFFATVGAAVLAGMDIPRSNYIARAMLVLVPVVVVGLLWGPFAYLALLILASPFSLPIFSFARFPIFGDLIGPLSFEQGAVLIFGSAFLLYLFVKSIRERKQFQAMPFVPLGVVLITGFFAAAFFAWFAGSEELNWYRQTILYGVIIFLLTYALARTALHIRLLTFGIMLTGVAFSVLVTVLPSSAYTYDAYTQVGRLGGEWALPLGFRMAGDSVYISTYLGLCSVLAWGETLGNRSFWQRIAFIVANVWLTRVQLLTISRTGLYGEIIGIILITLIYFLRPPLNISDSSKSQRSRTRQIYLGRFEIALITLGLLALLTFQITNFVENFQNPDYVLRLFESDLENDANTQIRVDLFWSSLEMNLASPLGTGSFALPSVTGINDHSIYTLLLSGLGWLGLGALVALFVWCIGRLIRGLNSTDIAIWKLSVSLFAGITVLLVMGLGHVVIGLHWGITIFWAMWGLSASMDRLQP
ncbi:MAG: hypothetical protein HZC40_02325 [Chloroflexi bacterium]|nr:hypothetical protein [Chloroflexota bacterium]